MVFDGKPMITTTLRARRRPESAAEGGVVVVIIGFPSKATENNQTPSKINARTKAWPQFGVRASNCSTPRFATSLVHK